MKVCVLAVFSTLVAAYLVTGAPQVQLKCDCSDKSAGANCQCDEKLLAPQCFATGDQCAGKHFKADGGKCCEGNVCHKLTPEHSECQKCAKAGDQCGGKSGAASCCSGKCMKYTETYSECVDCVPTDGQCGGMGWTGGSKCCDEEQYCKWFSPHYSQCTKLDCAREGTQCGGMNYFGFSKCCGNSSCNQMDSSYFECQDPSGCVKEGLQCGGKDFKGITNCCKGFKCGKKSSSYHICEKGKVCAKEGMTCGHGKDCCKGMGCQNGKCTSKCGLLNEICDDNIPCCDGRKCFKDEKTNTGRCLKQAPCAKAGQQCSGLGWKGPYDCCGSNLQCNYINTHLSACVVKDHKFESYTMPYEALAEE